MKNGGALCAIILCCAIAGEAQDVSLSGTVTGNGAGINGARVSLKNYPLLVAYTDGSGAFTLSGALPVINRKNFTGAGALPSIKNNNLLFTSAKSLSAVRIDLFALNGSRLFSQKLSNVAPGSHSVPLIKTAQGIYFVRLSVGTESYLMKMAAGMGSVVAKRQGMNLSASLAKGVASAGLIDTLIVTAQTWKHALVGLTDYREQLSPVTLTASNPWKPTGALMHDNGMVKIMAKGYDFEMGQPDPYIADAWTEYEHPVHTVQFTHDFWMDTTEVTQKMFDSIMGSVYTDYVAITWDPWFGVGDNYPVYIVYWGNAVLYCNARSKIEGLDTVYTYSEKNAPSGELVELFDAESDLSKNGYRLPTEAQWEYACKGGTATDFYWGKNYGPYPSTAADSAELGEYTVWRKNSFDFGDGQPGSGMHLVGSTKPNAYGLYDMAGNATEHIHDFWTDDFYHDGYGTVVDPAGPATGQWGHVLRGGNWGSDGWNLRSSYRNPNFNQPNYAIWFVGFRVVLPIP
jgi:formylglycine-generating enzyme required for sulfatase activity